MTEPWSAPAIIPSSFPTVASLRGRLVLIQPLKQQTVPNKLGAPGSTQEQVTANVMVVDGQGAVPQMSGNPPQPTGLMIDGPEWLGMWINSEVIVKQLADALRSGGRVLARVNTPDPNRAPGKGNAWGLIAATPEDEQIARNWFAARTVGAAQAPVQQTTAAPSPAAPAPVVQAQVQAAPPVAPALPVAGSAPAGVNPFL
jgi:hypothetical protein